MPLYCGASVYKIFHTYHSYIEVVVSRAVYVRAYRLLWVHRVAIPQRWLYTYALYNHCHPPTTTYHIAYIESASAETYICETIFSRENDWLGCDWGCQWIEGSKYIYAYNRRRHHSSIQEWASIWRRSTPPTAAYCITLLRKNRAVDFGL